MFTKHVLIRTLAESSAEINEAAALIRCGGLVVFPTETVYGLGASALDAHAAEKIYAAKGRPSDNPLIVHIADPSEADALAYPSDLYYRLARAFMPGPITVILPKKELVPDSVTAGLKTVAIRCPSHPVANALIRAAGVPIAAPSANLSGSPSPTTATHVKEDLDGRVDMILDGGAAEYGLESTIVRVMEDDSLLLLRPGAITLEDLRAVAERVEISSAVLGALKEGEAPQSPGMKYRHYAPKAPLFLLDGNLISIKNFLAEQNGRIAYLSYEEDADELSALSVSLYFLGKQNDKREQSARLFSLLRKVDKLHYDAIYAPLPSTDGMGMALYNRMIRAAAHQIISL